MSLQLSKQGGGGAGKPLIRALHLRNADTGWTAVTSWPKHHHPNDPAGKIKPATNTSLCKEQSMKQPAGLAAGWVPTAAMDICAGPPGPPGWTNSPVTEERNQVRAGSLRAMEIQFSGLVRLRMGEAGRGIGGPHFTHVPAEVRGHQPPATLVTSHYGTES